MKMSDKDLEKLKEARWIQKELKSVKKAFPLDYNKCIICHNNFKLERMWRVVEYPINSLFICRHCAPNKEEARKIFYPYYVKSGNEEMFSNPKLKIILSCIENKL